MRGTHLTVLAERTRLPARTGRAVEELQEMLAYMTGLAVAASLKAPWQHGRRQLGAGGLKLPVLVFR